MTRLSPIALLSAASLAACAEAGPVSPTGFDVAASGPELAVISVEGGGAGSTVPTQGTLDATVDVAESATIQDVNVTVSLTHTYVQYLTLRLVSPGGTTILLSQQRGGDGDNYTGTVFDDEATTSIGAGAAPFTGSFQPEQPLSGLDGEDQQGTWTLSIKNDWWIQTGTLTSWSLEITNDASTNTPVPTLVLGDIDTGVPDLTLPGGGTLSDAIAGCAADAKNHGQFVQCVARLATSWMKAGYIDGADRGRIVSAAARAGGL
jgi:subtilisin-like proprotein convertase family protein